MNENLKWVKPKIVRTVFKVTWRRVLGCLLDRVFMFSLQGGVAPPIQKAAKLFQEKYGIRIDFTIGKAEGLISGIREKKVGDILSCGAEYVTDEAETRLNSQREQKKCREKASRHFGASGEP